jgi:hypothetical protein
MLDVIVYDAIEKKNELESNSFVLTSHEALIMALDMMDFFRVLNKNAERPDDGIDWIILEIDKPNSSKEG